MLEKASLPKSILVDCSHDNSAKKPELQPDVMRQLLAQITAGNHSIMGAMVESNLSAGSQPFPQPKANLRYGVSITDACIDWPSTEVMVREIHATLAPQFTWPPPTTATPPPPPPPSAKPAADPNAFNEAAARSGLARASGVLAFCTKEGGVTGPGNASVTFGNDGSVAGVALDPPYAGTPAGNCVAGQFRRAKVNAYTGAPQSVRISFDVPK